MLPADGGDPESRRRGAPRRRLGCPPRQLGARIRQHRRGRASAWQCRSGVVVHELRARRAGQLRGADVYRRERGAVSNVAAAVIERQFQVQRLGMGAIRPQHRWFRQRREPDRHDGRGRREPGGLLRMRHVRLGMGRRRRGGQATGIVTFRRAARSAFASRRARTACGSIRSSSALTLHLLTAWTGHQRPDDRAAGRHDQHVLSRSSGWRTLPRRRAAARHAASGCARIRRLARVEEVPATPISGSRVSQTSGGCAVAASSH